MTIKDYKHMIRLQHTHTESKVAIKDDRLNSTHFFIMKIPTKRELQQIALNHSSDISTKGFINVYKRCTAEPYIFFFLVNDTTLALDNPLQFRKNLFNINKNDNN